MFSVKILHIYILIYINPSFSAVLNALQLFQMVIIHLLGFALIKKNKSEFLGHNFVDMLDGRYQCLTCSKHITGMYQGKEHAPHLDNIFGEITAVQCDQAGRIPICDKCTRPVTSEEEAFKHDTRYYHLDCARCNRCRKKLFRVPCRKLGSALGKKSS
jgi:hypothetical protein